MQVCGPSAKPFLFIKLYVVASLKEATSVVTTVSKKETLKQLTASSDQIFIKTLSQIKNA
jgi:hypothetical protein